MNIKSLISLWNHTQQHAGTSGARVCAAVLLGLYNGARFPMDLTDLRILDAGLLNDSLAVITADSGRCQKEVHEWLNCVSGRYDFGERFEALAFEYKTFKRGCVGKRGDYAHITRLAIDEPSEIVGRSATSVIVDELFGMPVVESTAVPAGEIWFQQSIPRGTAVAKFDIDAHQRAMSTPFFNDLAG